MPSPQQPDEPPALDALYEALTEIQSHLHEHQQEQTTLIEQLEQTERDLLEQRAAAAKAGERATYDRLSADLARLTRAWRVAQEDPDADPMDEYQPDESEPETPPDGTADQPPTEDQT